MNRLQKKILTIAFALGNIVLTSVVASTATFAWFKMAQANIDVKSETKGFSIGADTGLSLSYEVLAYDDDAKEGVSYQGNAENFKLRDYDRYISYNHKYENAIMRVVANFSDFTDQKEINIDITCSQPLFSSGTTVSNYTSNVIQFKTSVVSYTQSNVNGSIHLNDYIIDEVDEDGHLSSAAQSYETATTYFKTIDSSDSFVSAYKDTASKFHYTLTCVPYLPTDSLGADHTITSAVIYIECSYNEDAVQYYIDHKDEAASTKLTGDITKIEFKNVETVQGGYERTSSTPASGNWNGDYLAVFENNVKSGDGAGLALDGSATSAQINNKANFFKVDVESNAIKANSAIHKKDIDVNEMSSGYSLQTEGANYIGHGTDAAITTSSSAIENSISSSGVISSTSDSNRDLRFYDYTGAAKFGYLLSSGTSNKTPVLYKYNGSYVAPVLTNITAAANKTNYVVGEALNVNTDVVVTAHYQNGDSKIVTSSCEFAGYDMTTSGTQTVNVYYTENNITMSTSYSIIVSSTPYIELTDYEMTIGGVSISRTITATPHNFTDEVLFQWTSSNTAVANITSGGESTTVTFSSVSAGTTNLSCYATDGTHEATATCIVRVVVSSSIWKLVEDANSIQAGDQVVIAATDYDYAMSTTQNSNNRGQASITKNVTEKTLIFAANAGVATFDVVTGTATNSFGFYDSNENNSGYICAASSSKNILETQEALDANGSFTISIDAGAATLTAQGSCSRNVIQYNNSSNLFSCYSSGQKNISLYKLESGDPLTGLSYSGTVVNQYSGRYFDATGLSVIATYQSGVTKDVTSSVIWNSGNTMTMGTTLVPFSYTEDGVTKVSYVVDVTVIQTVLESLQITGTPTTTTYITGSKFNHTGLTVKAIYNFSASGVDVTENAGLKWYAKDTTSETLPLGTTQITATYTDGEGLTASIDVSTAIIVVDKTLSSIEVTGGTTQYYIDTTFDFNSTVTAHYNSEYPGLVPDEILTSGYSVQLEGYSIDETSAHKFTQDDVNNSPLDCIVTYQGKTDVISIDVESVPVYGEYTGAITEGDYLIVDNTDNYAMSNTLNTSKKLTATSVTINNKTINNPSSSLVWHISTDSNGNLVMYNAAVKKYAGLAKTGDTTMELASTCTSDNEQFTITETSSGSSNYYIRSVLNTARYLLYSSSQFQMYAQSNKVRLYKKGYTPSAVIDVTLNSTTLNLDVPASGSPMPTGTLIATVTGTGSYSTEVNWNSSKESVATVSNGAVTAVGAGTTTITVTSVQDPTKNATCTVIVSLVSSITIDKTSLVLRDGDIGTLTLTYNAGWDSSTYPSSTINWTCSDTSSNYLTINVSTDKESCGYLAVSSDVDQNFTITATLGNGKTAVCNVTIKASGSQTETTVTYTFTDENFADSTGSWSCTTAAFGFNDTKGIQRTKGTAEAITKSEYTITSISITAATTKDGVGTYTLYVGDTIAGTKSLSKNTTSKTYSICSGVNYTGKLKIVMNCTTNSLYLKSITITYLA